MTSHVAALIQKSNKTNMVVPERKFTTTPAAMSAVPNHSDAGCKEVDRFEQCRNQCYGWQTHSRVLSNTDWHEKEFARHKFNSRHPYK
jgi:hypothetical protein